MFEPQPIHAAHLTPAGVPTSAWGLLGVFLRRRFAGRIALLMLTSAGGVGLMSLEPVALKALVNGLAAGGGWNDSVLFWFVALGALWFASALFNRAREVVDLYTSPALRQEVQFYLFSHLVDHSPRYFQDSFAGKLGQKVKQAGQAAMQLLQVLTDDIVRIVVVLAVGLTLLFDAHPRYALLLVGWTVLQLGVSSLLARRCLDLSRGLSEEVAASTGVLIDMLSNIELVRAFARRAHEFGLLSDALHKEFAASQRLRWFLTRMWLVIFNGLLFFQIALIGMAVSDAMAGRMGVGDFAMVFSLSSIVGINVYNLSSRFLNFFEQLGTLEGALELIARPHEITDRPGAPALRVPAGAIRFDAVGFGHADGTPVFNALSLDVAAGEKLALVGPSGAGKSTLVRLLRRQFEAQAGSIRIDGQDVAAVTLESLNRAIAEVPQAPALFHRSIFDNIAYAKPEASREEVEAAARRAHCDGFVAARPAGYDAIVGEQGIRLSGGERQRIAIARAFLKDAPILVLDEATSALDSETEHLIQHALWELFQGRTVIAIAHRLSTITGMDRIAYLEEGRILEQGSHAALLAANGPYARLWQRQVGGFLPG